MNFKLPVPAMVQHFMSPSGKLIKWIPGWPKVIGSLTKPLGLAHSLATYKIEIKKGDVHVEL